MTYIQPSLLATSFTCPHCGAISQQRWWWTNWQQQLYAEKNNSDVYFSMCTHCEKSSLWVKDKMHYPDTGNAPFPNNEMPERVKELYLEAASIANKSPRGAAALLRLAIQYLCTELGEKGNKINDDIASLVRKGLPEIVQQSLDIVRVTGNDAVHPGQIDTDDIEVVSKLFELINVIVEYQIALPNKVSGLFSALPTGKLKGIENRDS